MKKILIFVTFVILFSLTNVYAYETTYQGASNKVYVVGSGADEVGVNTGSSNAIGNIQFVFLFKGDIIRYVPDTMNTNVSTAGKTYTLGAGFTFSDNNQDDVTSNYARIISTHEGGTFGNTGLPIYQEVEITSEYPIVLYSNASWPTSQGTIYTDENNNSWYYRSQTWSVSPYQVDHNITWNLNGGAIYGETELPNKYYFSEEDYTITLANPPVKRSSHFTEWTFSTTLAKLSQVSPTVIKESKIKFNNNSSQGTVVALNNTNYDVTVTANYTSGKTLEFVLDGGTLEGISDSYIVEISDDTVLGSVINAYTPRKKNSTFVGWYSDSELTNRIEDATEVDCSSSNTEVYAKWEEGPIEITDVEVRGITVPVVGGNPETTGIEIVTPGLTATWAEWFEEGGGALTSTDTFEAGKRYYLLFRATPEEGYEYTGDILIYPEDHVTATPAPIKYDHGHDGVEFEFYYDAVNPTLRNPKATITGDNSSLTITWDEQYGVVKAEVYRSNSKTKGYKKVATVTTDSYKNTGLTYGKTYYYKVRVYNGTKWSSYSNIVSKKVVPNKVANVKVLTQGPNNIKVGWDKIGVTGYQIQRSTNNKKWSTVKTITKNSTLNFNNTKLSVNKTYYYRVRAYKKVGSKKVYGGWSTVLVAKTTPAKPTLALSMKDVNEVYIKIGKASGATSYVVERSLDGSTYTLYDTLTGAATLTNIELTTGNRYYYRVKGCNGELCSPWVSSSIVSSTKTPGLTLKTTSKKVTVTITPVTGATGYEVYRSMYKNKKFSKIKTVLTEEELLSFINSTSKGKTYYYKVRAFIDSGDTRVYSSYSAVKKIKSK